MKKTALDGADRCVMKAGRMGTSFLTMFFKCMAFVLTWICVL